MESEPFREAESASSRALALARRRARTSGGARRLARLDLLEGPLGHVGAEAPEEEPEVVVQPRRAEGPPGVDVEGLQAEQGQQGQQEEEQQRLEALHPRAG